MGRAPGSSPVSSQSQGITDTTPPLCLVSLFAAQATSWNPTLTATDRPRHSVLGNVHIPPIFSE